MGEPLADWLRLREAADWAARSVALTRAVASTMPANGPVQVLDLATGTGSNLRYLIEHLPPRQHWLLVDRSPGLLALVQARTAAWASERGYALHQEDAGFSIVGDRLQCRVRTRQLDLDRLDDQTLFDGRHLVTASALLDLVSDRWLDQLAAACRDAGAAALFALSYNGRSSCTPGEPEDERVRALMNAHQRRDKGLGGPAAGPDATASGTRAFGGVGYRVEAAESDWTVGPDQREFQRQLIDGWAEAATEQQPDLAPQIAGWHARRLAHLSAGRSQVVVGHHDLAAWPVGS